jgi:hypothetical protein
MAKKEQMMAEYARTEISSDEIIRAMGALQLFGLGTQPDLSDDQKRLVTQFRLMRNGLGNYGGHGDNPDRALMDSPTITEKNKGYWEMQFAAALPAHAQWVYLWYPPGDQHATAFRDEFPVKAVDGLELTINYPGAILVEIVDMRRETIVAGIPITITSPVRPPYGYESDQDESYETDYPAN